jgi:hypothetical protein
MSRVALLRDSGDVGGGQLGAAKRRGRQRCGDVSKPKPAPGTRGSEPAFPAGRRRNPTRDPPARGPCSASESRPARVSGAERQHGAPDELGVRLVDDDCGSFAVVADRVGREAVQQIGDPLGRLDGSRGVVRLAQPDELRRAGGFVRWPDVQRRSPLAGPAAAPRRTRPRAARSRSDTWRTSASAATATDPRAGMRGRSGPAPRRRRRWAGSRPGRRRRTRRPPRPAPRSRWAGIRTAADRTAGQHVAQIRAAAARC